MDCERIVELGMVYIAEDRHLFPEMSSRTTSGWDLLQKSARQRETELDFVFDMFPGSPLSAAVRRRSSPGEARMLAIGGD
jgi:ABC-type branched-subunit amino acid transport system ATPase component